MLFISLIYYALPGNATPGILVLGDSLSAGYGLQPGQSWVSLLTDKINAEHLDFLVVNASVSGATTGDGLQDLPGLLQANKPQILILALGSNDGLRGQPIMVIKQNLSKMIQMAKNDDVKVLLVGFKIPSNYGAMYTNAFSQMFADLSDKYSLKFAPFLLDGFADNKTYFQQDQLHPTAEAQPIMLNIVWKYLAPMIKS